MQHSSYDRIKQAPRDMTNQLGGTVDIANKLLPQIGSFQSYTVTNWDIYLKFFATT